MQVAATVICLLLTSHVLAQPQRRDLNWREKDAEDIISTSSAGGSSGVSNAEIYVRPEVLRLLRLRNRPIKKHFNTIPEWVLGSEQAKPSVVILLPEDSADHEQFF